MKKKIKEYLFSGVMTALCFKVTEKFIAPGIDFWLYLGLEMLIISLYIIKEHLFNNKQPPVSN
jgi:hypothetical protein